MFTPQRLFEELSRYEAKKVSLTQLTNYLRNAQRILEIQKPGLSISIWDAVDSNTNTSFYSAFQSVAAYDPLLSQWFALNNQNHNANIQAPTTIQNHNSNNNSQYGNNYTPVLGVMNLHTNQVSYNLLTSLKSQPLSVWQNTLNNSNTNPQAPTVTNRDNKTNTLNPQPQRKRKSEDGTTVIYNGDKKTKIPKLSLPTSQTANNLSFENLSHSVITDNKLCPKPEWSPTNINTVSLGDIKKRNISGESVNTETITLDLNSSNSNKTNLHPYENKTRKINLTKLKRKIKEIASLISTEYETFNHPGHPNRIFIKGYKPLIMEEINNIFLSRITKSDNNIKKYFGYCEPITPDYLMVSLDTLNVILQESNLEPIKVTENMPAEEHQAINEAIAKMQEKSLLEKTLDRTTTRLKSIFNTLQKATTWYPSKDSNQIVCIDLQTQTEAMNARTALSHILKMAKAINEYQDEPFPDGTANNKHRSITLTVAKEPLDALGIKLTIQNTADNNTLQQPLAQKISSVNTTTTTTSNAELITSAGFFGEVNRSILRTPSPIKLSSLRSSIEASLFDENTNPNSLKNSTEKKQADTDFFTNNQSDNQNFDLGILSTDMNNFDFDFDNRNNHHDFLGPY